MGIRSINDMTVIEFNMPEEVRDSTEYVGLHLKPVHNSPFLITSYLKKNVTVLMRSQVEAYQGNSAYGIHIEQPNV